MKLLMIINAKSGIKNSKSKLLDVIDVFCGHGYNVTTYVTQKRNDAYEYLMKNRIHYDLIGVFGGDGTMNEVTNALMHKKNKVPLAYFPSGTMNDFASNFNLGTDFVEIAKRACKAHEKYFDVGQFNDKYFNYVAAFGALCDVPFTTDRNAKEIFGNIAYILEGISKLTEIKKNEVTYTINGSTYHKDVLFGVIYSGNRVAGMELESKNRARVDDGFFNVMIIEYVPSIFETPDLFTTLIQNSKYIQSFKCDTIELHFKNKVIWTLDGEEAKVKDKVKITIHNKALKLYA